jgi:hypothetical protein
MPEVDENRAILEVDEVQAVYQLLSADLPGGVVGGYNADSRAYDLQDIAGTFHDITSSHNSLAVNEHPVKSSPARKSKLFAARKDDPAP